MSFWYRRTQSPPPIGLLPAITTEPPLGVHVFRAWTESLQISGRIRCSDRLSDALNRREPVRVDGPVVSPIGGEPSGYYQVPEMTVDPFDLEVVAAFADDRSPEDRGARRIHKVRYPVKIDAGRFVVRGQLHVFPGNAPEFIAHHTGALFFPVTDARIERDGHVVAGRGASVALVNRYAIRRITQLDTTH